MGTTEKTTIYNVRRKQQAAPLSSELAPPPGGPDEPTVVQCQSEARAAISTLQSKSISDITASIDTTVDLLRSMKLKAYERSASVRSQPAKQAQMHKRSAPVKALPLQPSTIQDRKQHVNSALQARIDMSMLTDTASSIKSAFHKIYRRAGCVLASVQAKSFWTGSAYSMTSSRVDICDDRLDYRFIHPQHGQIQMLMRYQDIDAGQLDMRTGRLSFHVARPLHQFGSQIYNHSLPFYPPALNQPLHGGKGNLGMLSMVIEGEKLPLVATLLKQHVPCIDVVCEQH